MPTLEMQNLGDITHKETKQDRIDEKMLKGLDIGKHWNKEIVRSLRGMLAVTCPSTLRNHKMIRDINILYLLAIGSSL